METSTTTSTKIRTLKTLSGIQSFLSNPKNCCPDKTIVFESTSNNAAAYDIDFDMFSFINESNLNWYENNMPTIIFKDVRYCGAIFNNPILSEKIISKITFENTEYRLNFFGIFKYNQNLSNESIAKFFFRHRDLDPEMYGTREEFFNKYFVPNKYEDDFIILFLTGDLLRVRSLPTEAYKYIIFPGKIFSDGLHTESVLKFLQENILI
jgi:hypothetical protein